MSQVRIAGKTKVALQTTSKKEQLIARLYEFEKNIEQKRYSREELGL